MRVIVLLLAVVMMTGVAGQVACASPDVASAVDDVPDVGTAVLPEPSDVPVPECHGAVQLDEPPPVRGRMHAVSVFRPPRLVASR